MSGDAPKDAVDSKPESKSTEEQSSLWAEIARDMAIGGAVGGLAGPAGLVLGTEAGLVWGVLSNSAQAFETAKHLYESVKEFAESPMGQKAIKDLGKPIMMPDPAKQLVEEKTESLLKNDKVRTAAEILFPPLALYDLLTEKKGS